MRWPLRLGLPCRDAAMLSSASLRHLSAYPRPLIINCVRLALKAMHQSYCPRCSSTFIGSLTRAIARFMAYASASHVVVAQSYPPLPIFTEMQGHGFCR